MAVSICHFLIIGNTGTTGQTQHDATGQPCLQEFTPPIIIAAEIQANVEPLSAWCLEQAHAIQGRLSENRFLLLKVKNRHARGNAPCHWAPRHQRAGCPGQYATRYR